MALTYSDKARLALRLVTARFLDDSEVAGNSADAEAFLAARNRLVTQVDDATEQELKDHAAASRHLLRAADKVRDLARSRNCQLLIGASAELERIAANLTEDDGDMRVIAGAPAAQPCSCGVLDLVRLIDAIVRDAYERADASHKWPDFKYKTWLVPLNTQSVPLQLGHVSGKTQIDRAPRRVTLLIRNRELMGVELCQLTYVVFHELVCHGYQHLLPNMLSSNAYPTCQWTEGWMDACACDLAVEWVTGPAGGPHPWLPYGGLSAIEHVRDFHRQRHTGPGDAKLRRAARNAYRLLAVAFQENGIACSSEDCNDLARRFSVIANAHPGAGHQRLKKLCARLEVLLHSPTKQYETGYVAAACFDFIENRDFDKLLKSLGCG